MNIGNLNFNTIHQRVYNTRLIPFKNTHCFYKNIWKILYNCFYTKIGYPKDGDLKERYNFANAQVDRGTSYCVKLQ